MGMAGSKKNRNHVTLDAACPVFDRGDKGHACQCNPPRWRSARCKSQFAATDVQQSGAQVNFAAALATAATSTRPGWFAAALGALTRRRSRRPDAAGTDGSTLLYNRDGFLLEGNVLLASCRRERRELTLAVFNCDDLPEARQVYGNRTSRKLIDCIIGKMTQLFGNFEFLILGHDIS